MSDKMATIITILAVMLFFGWWEAGNDLKGIIVVDIIGVVYVACIVLLFLFVHFFKKFIWRPYIEAPLENLLQKLLKLL